MLGLLDWEMNQEFTLIYLFIPQAPSLGKEMNERKRAGNQEDHSPAFVI